MSPSTCPHSFACRRRRLAQRLYTTTPLCSRWLRSAHFQSWARLLGPKLIMKCINALQRLRLENACILIQCLSFLATHATNFLISVMKVLTKTCNWTCKFQFWFPTPIWGSSFAGSLGRNARSWVFGWSLGFCPHDFLTGSFKRTPNHLGFRPVRPLKF